MPRNAPLSDLELALLVHQMGADHPLFNPIHPIVGAAKAIGHAAAQAEQAAAGYLTQPDYWPQKPPAPPPHRRPRVRPGKPMP